MHETTIAKKVIEDVKAKTSNAQVISVEVEVGELAPITAEELKRALRLLIDWDAKVDTREALVDCSSCGYQGKPKGVMRHHDVVTWECFKCQAKMPDALQGDKILIKSVKTK